MVGKNLKNTHTLECDVLVVGAGPAGSSTALFAAKHGLKTILIEEHPEVGFPVQCAEAIGSSLIPKLPIKIPKKQLKWVIDGMYLWADGIAVIKKGGVWSGYSINRHEWDSWLATLACREGVKLLTNSKLETLTFEKNHFITEAYVNSNGRQLQIIPKFLVAADGVDSTILDLLKVREKNAIGYVRSFEMKNIDLHYPTLDQIYFGDFAPHAYAYIFPLSRSKANVGVGTIYGEKRLDDLFEKFFQLDLVKKQVTRAKKVVEKSGRAPIKPLSKKTTYGNIFLVGDAANQNIKPFIEGNLPSVVCGSILGSFLRDIVDGKAIPQSYDTLINNKLRILKDSQPIADYIFGETEVDPRFFSLIILGLMSEMIPPREKSIHGILKKGPIYLRNFILREGGFIEKN